MYGAKTKVTHKRSRIIPESQSGLAQAAKMPDLALLAVNYCLKAGHVKLLRKSWIHLYLANYLPSLSLYLEWMNELKSLFNFE